MVELMSAHMNPVRLRMGSRCQTKIRGDTMDLKKHKWAIPFAVISALTITVPIVSARGIQDKHSPEASTATRTIRGVWRTVVTGRNCQTGEPVGSLLGLFTFNQGGTMSEYGIGPGSSP